MRLLWVPCSNSGTTFWRGTNFWTAAERQRLIFWHGLWWQRDLVYSHPWEEFVNLNAPNADHQQAYNLTYELQERARQADAVVFQAVHTRASLECVYFIKEKFPWIPVLTEIDDNILDLPEYNSGLTAFRPGSIHLEIQKEQMRHTDGIITSTPYLKEVYSEFNPHIYVVPNAIDTILWDKAREHRKRKPGLRIGWFGAGNHAEDLRIIEPVVHNILKKHPEVTFVFVHGIPDFLKNIPRCEYSWRFERIDKYPAYVASQGLDIGLAPLLPNAFNRSKSNLRWLEYSALGIPSVCSKVGHFEQTINHGVDGFLASGSSVSEMSADFEKHVETLISDADLRRKMGKAAYLRTRTDFNVENVIDVYHDALKDVVKRGPWAKVPVPDVGWEDVKPLEPLNEEVVQ